MELCLLKLTNTKYPLIVLGDINCPNIELANHMAPSSGLEYIMYDLMTSYGLEQFVNEPTRLDKVLDVVFTNEPLILQSVVTNEPYCISDHCMIDFVISCSNLVDNSPHKMYTKYLWRNADYVSMSDYLTAVD